MLGSKARTTRPGLCGAGKGTQDLECARQPFTSQATSPALCHLPMCHLCLFFLELLGVATLLPHSKPAVWHFVSLCPSSGASPSLSPAWGQVWGGAGGWLSSLSWKHDSSHSAPKKTRPTPSPAPCQPCSRSVHCSECVPRSAWVMFLCCASSSLIENNSASVIGKCLLFFLSCT